MFFKVSDSKDSGILQDDGTQIKAFWRKRFRRSEWGKYKVCLLTELHQEGGKVWPFPHRLPLMNEFYRIIHPCFIADLSVRVCVCVRQLNFLLFWARLALNLTLCWLFFPPGHVITHALSTCPYPPTPLPHCLLWTPATAGWSCGAMCRVWLRVFLDGCWPLRAEPPAFRDCLSLLADPPLLWYSLHLFSTSVSLPPSSPVVLSFGT